MKSKMHTILCIICLCGLVGGVIYNIGNAPEWMREIIGVGVVMLLFTMWKNDVKEDRKEAAKEALDEYFKR